MIGPLKWILSYTDIEIERKEEINLFVHDMTISGSKVEGISNPAEAIKRVLLGKCLDIKAHENSDRLFICQMDIGKRDPIQVVTAATNVRKGTYMPCALDGAILKDGFEIKKGKLRGVESNGMLCSFEELDLDHENYPGGIEDGIMILDDLDEFKDSNLESMLGQDIMKVLGADETRIEFEITSNRPDCFSITGLAREAAITRGRSFKMPVIKVLEEANEKASDHIRVRIEDPDLCHRYIARLVSDVKIGPSPKWMRDRLINAGVRPINNIVDITNYVMLEIGHPMHAFDRKHVRGDEIIVRPAFDKEEIITLDDITRVLDSQKLVIADKEGPIAIAGVMGGENSGVEDDSKEIILEAAMFDPYSVRKTAKDLGLRTESSARFEKGLNPISCQLAMDRACMLIEELGAGKVLKGSVDNYPREYKDREVAFDFDKINKLLGTDLSYDYMKSLLERLECRVEGDKVYPPYFRPDLICNADLAEEVARFYGYNNIEPSLLKDIETTLGRRNRRQIISDKLRNIATGLGYSEALTYSFESPNVFDKLELSLDSPLRDYVKIINPLGEDFSAMRTSMVPSLLKVLAANYAKRNEDTKIYEVSYIYIKDEDEKNLPEHREVLSLGAYGPYSFYDIKGDLEAIFKLLKIEGVSYRPSKDITYMHPGVCGQIFINNKHIGFIGQVHPRIAKNFDCPAKTFAAFINLADIVDNAKLIPEYKELAKFPAVTRDFALVLDKEVLASEVEKVIRERGGALLEKVELFDYYEGPQVGDGKKSLAYALSFRDPTKTLTDEDVNKITKKILHGLDSVLGARIRE